MEVVFKWIFGFFNGGIVFGRVYFMIYVGLGVGWVGSFLRIVMK